VNTGDESLIKRVLRAYIVCGACGNNRTNWAGFQFAAARLPGFFYGTLTGLLLKKCAVRKLF
ncbi:hypothetical protein, partial [Escherichia coli]|uniref:hypothetical protein n=1 Tax=Escherichia coli TaxID=562 RepID=UPI001A9239B0